jgi:hemerythrin-like metal-binding protein
MASITWDYSCSVGVQVMDDQHGILLDALNELRVALLHGAEGKAVRGMLARVTELMRLHVESEERLLALYGFPELTAHKAEHQRLMGRLAQFNTRFEQRQTDSVYELVEYLRKWFTTHTGVAGKKYGPWLQKCGVQ